MGVAVLIGQRAAARNRPRIGALHLGERFAHQPEAHVHGVTYALGLATGLHQSVKLVVGVGVAERTAQRFFLLFLAGIGAAHTLRTAGFSEPFRLPSLLRVYNTAILEAADYRPSSLTYYFY